MIRFALLVTLLASPGLALAQDATGQHGGIRHVPGMSHEGHGMNAYAVPSGLMEGGQSAFAAIQEIVAQLMANPSTD